MRFTSPKSLILPQGARLQGAHTTLYATDDETQLIIDLMRAEADKLGFIPIPSLIHTIQTRDALIWQRDAQNRKMGYLIHSHPRPNRPIQVHLTVIDIDRRRRKWATRALAELIAKAYRSDAPYIRLRCAADLEANKFWLANGFEPVAHLPNLRKNEREIILYHLPKTKYAEIRLPILAPAVSIPSPRITTPRRCR